VESERNEGSLADEAAARVQAIVAAAETSARQLREDAEREAGEHVEHVAAAARALLERIEALGSDVDGLRDRAAGLTDAVAALTSDAGALGGTAAAETPAAAEPEAAGAEPAPVEAAPAADGGRSADEAGARLVALNMALEGSPREATARYLAEQFELADLDALLDDVYASAGR
jgi:hypothetical protein